MEKTTDCTVWDNSKIFKSSKDPKVEATLQEIQKLSEDFKVQTSYFLKFINEPENIKQEELIKNLQRALKHRIEIVILCATVRTYFSCITSVNTKDEGALKKLSEVGMLLSKLSQYSAPMEKALVLLNDECFELLFEDPEVKDMEFSLRQSRERKDFQLSVSEEELISGLETTGLHAWGDLYSAIEGGMVCDVEGEKIGLAEAASLLRQGDREKRKSAWLAIKKAWEGQEQTAAAILNAINGWRIEERSVRSKVRVFDPLEESCHASHITKKTLETLIDVTYQHRTLGQRALNAMAKVIGVEATAAWDTLAPAPVDSGAKFYSFKEGVSLVTDAFRRFSPEMGEFAQMMYKNNWIDSKPSTNRSAGAYCTEFVSVQEPRVFQTYNGSISDILTLAHELGHAYHSWVMRDLPFPKTWYAMTTAETASIFAEALVRDYLLAKSTSHDEKLTVAWEDAVGAASMLCNIPARFEFEKNFVEARKKGALSATEMKSIMSEAWKKWFGPALSNYDEMYWASKQHFSFSEIGFYNYPYLFGYLFSLGIYSQKEALGDQFNAVYLNVLRDTGSMNAVDLIKKHFNQSIEEAAFWENSLKVVEKSILQFEQLVN